MLYLFGVVSVDGVAVFAHLAIIAAICGLTPDGLIANGQHFGDEGMKPVGATAVLYTGQLTTIFVNFSLKVTQDLS